MASSDTNTAGVNLHDWRYKQNKVWYLYDEQWGTRSIQIGISIIGGVRCDGKLAWIG